MGISDKQLRKIYVLKKKAGMSNEELHCLARGLAGVESMRALNTRQAARIIDRLSIMTGEKREIAARATPAQQHKILALAREMGWAGEPGRLRSFLEKKAKVSDVRFLSIDSARWIIEAMKAMQAGGRAERRRQSERMDEGDQL